MKLLVLPFQFLIVCAKEWSKKARAWINMTIFVILSISHFCIHPFYVHRMNQFYEATYALLVWGAFCRLLAVYHDGHFSDHSDYDILYYILLVPVVLLGCTTIYWPGMGLFRERLNAYVKYRFSAFDVADNPELIHRFDLGGELRTPDRIGKLLYATASFRGFEQLSTHPSDM